MKQRPLPKFMFYSFFFSFFTDPRKIRYPISRKKTIAMTQPKKGLFGTKPNCGKESRKVHQKRKTLQILFRFA